MGSSGIRSRRSNIGEISGKDGQDFGGGKSTARGVPEAFNRRAAERGLSQGPVGRRGTTPPAPAVDAEAFSARSGGSAWSARSAQCRVAVVVV